MKNILLVAENKSSIELVEHIDSLIQKGDESIKYKIGSIKKVNKDKNRYPQLKLHNGNVIEDINQIYFYLLSDNRGPSRPRRQARNEYDQYEGLDFSDIIEQEMGYDDEGRAARGEDYDDEPMQRRTKKGYDSDDDIPIDSNAITQRFNEHRSNIKVPQIRNKPKQQNDYDEGPRKGKSKQQSKKSKRRDEYSDESSDAPDDGKRALEDFYYQEAKSRSRE